MYNNIHRKFNTDYSNNIHIIVGIQPHFLSRLMREQGETLPSSTTLTLVLPGVIRETDTLAIFSQDHIISEMKQAFLKI